ncbi:MAG: citrate/2-methylcitrate synthase, partial [Aquiluna sp.]
MTSAETQKVVIRVGDNETELPVVKATEGASGIDIAGLMSATGMSTFDQGFVNTSSTKSAITYIDGDAGILRYRGYPIEQLAAQKSFIEVAYLLIYGELPDAKQLEDFDWNIRRHTLLHEDLKDFFRSFPQSAHPMAVISAGVSALSTFYPDSLDPKDQDQVELSTIRLLAKMPVLAAYAHKTSLGQALM